MVNAEPIEVGYVREAGQFSAPSLSDRFGSRGERCDHMLVRGLSRGVAACWLDPPSVEVDDAVVAVDGDDLAGVDDGGADVGADDGGQAEFAGDDGAV